MKQRIRTAGAPAPIGPYSQAVSASGHFLFVSGQTPKDPKTDVIPEDFCTQAERCLENLKAIIEAAGATMADVVKVNAYLTDLGQFSTFNEIYARYFTEPFPARTTVGAVLPGISLEIDAIVALPL
jgi:2-iminobutanoate/2-iminopropanoate deaminase